MRLTSRVLSSVIVFTALTTAATMVISVYVPATKGYFNVGEIMVYASALLMGPYIGAFTGGVGSMLADLFLGYPIFAPATLLIKAVEGFIVGSLGGRRPFKSSRGWKGFSILMALAVALVVAFIGTSLYSGSVETTLGFPQLGTQTLTGEVPQLFWLALAGLAFVAIAASGMKVDPALGWVAFSVLIGGLEMVVGYFLYEQLILGYYALAEVPVNIGQATIGLIVSIPLVKAVRSAITPGKPEKAPAKPSSKAASKP